VTIDPSLDDPLLSVNTVAEIFDVQPAQVRVWIKSGKIKAQKVLGRWRILQSEVRRVANEEYGA
jgi:predicted site-specific integrase-resolvase